MSWLAICTPFPRPSPGVHCPCEGLSTSSLSSRKGEVSLSRICAHHTAHCENACSRICLIAFCWLAMATFGRLCSDRVFSPGIVAGAQHPFQVFSCSSLLFSLCAVLYFTPYICHPSGSDKYPFINEKVSPFHSFSDNV